MSSNPWLLLAAAVALHPVGASAQTTIGLGPPPTIGGYAFGVDQFGDLGQTFTAPVTGSLLDFSFWMYAAAPDARTTFTAHLYEWTGGGIGAELFASTPYDVAVPFFSPTRYMVDVAGVPVSAGGGYLALFRPTMAYLPDQVALSTIGSYDGGDLYGGSFGAFGDADANFEATFASSVVPEPSTWLLLGTGLLGIAAVAARRRREGEGPGV